MSLIDTLENLETEFGDVWICKDLGAQIIAALKAGQKMRKGIIYIESDSGPLIGCFGQEIADSIKAWDEATKGKE